MIKLGSGKETWYVVAECVNMGTNRIVIKLTNNEAWAKVNTIIAKVKADSRAEAMETFSIDDYTINQF